MDRGHRAALARHHGRLKPGKVCPRCWRDAPCAIHSRPKNARWSKDRDGAKQHHFRRNTLEHDHYTCQRCGLVDPSGTKLDAHHVTPTQGTTLCNSKGNGCHAATDSHAR